MSVQIRPPRSGDAEDMARVWLSAGAYYAELNPAHFPLPSNNPVPNAAHQSVREVGWTGLFVDAPAVDRALWRKGIGSALLEAAEWWGRDRGAGVVRLNTYADGPVAVPFYERHGYRRRSIVFAKELA